MISGPKYNHQYFKYVVFHISMKKKTGTQLVSWGHTTILQPTVPQHAFLFCENRLPNSQKTPLQSTDLTERVTIRAPTSLGRSLSEHRPHWEDHCIAAG